MKNSYVHETDLFCTCRVVLWVSCHRTADVVYELFR